MPQQVPGTINQASSIPSKVGRIQQDRTDNKTKKGMNSFGMNPVGNTTQVSTPEPVSNPINPFGNPQVNPNPQAMPSVTGMSPGMVPGQYGGMVTPDADGRGFTNADGGHDWNVGQGPGGDWHGEDQKTGQPPIGQDPGSGDALGIPRGTPQYRQATQAHKNWIQQNRAAGRTLADLGMNPTRGGGLANFMEMAGTPRGVAGGVGIPQPGLPSTGFTTNPVGDPNLGGLSGFGTKGAVPSTPYTGPGLVNNNMAPGAVPTPTAQPITAQKRQPMKSRGFGQRPMNTSRLM